MTSFTELEQIIQQCTWNHKRPRIAKAILRNKTQPGGITCPNLKQYTKPQSSRQCGTGTKNRHTDKWNRIQNAEINSDIYGQLIFDKGGKNLSAKKAVYSVRIAEKPGQLYVNQ